MSLGSEAAWRRGGAGGLLGSGPSWGHLLLTVPGMGSRTPRSPLHSMAFRVELDQECMADTSACQKKASVVFACDAHGCPQSHLPDGPCPRLLTHRCLRKGPRVPPSDPRCCAHSPRPWGSPSCRSKWTVTYTARSRCVGIGTGQRQGQGLVSFPAVVARPLHRVSRDPGHRLMSVLPVQPLLFPGDAGGSGMFGRHSASPSSLLDTAVSEEVRQGQDLGAEREAQRPLCGSSGRRHTLAEVSSFSPCAPPCKCPRGPRAVSERAYGQGHERLKPDVPPLLVTILSSVIGSPAKAMGSH